MMIVLAQLCEMAIATSSEDHRNGRGFLGFLILSLIVVLGAGCQSSSSIPSEPANYAAAGDQVYRLGPGDKVRVIVFGQEDLSGVFEVDSVGRIALPLIRGVNVEGQTIPELEQSITERLVANFFADPKVSIELVKSRPFCILGEVKNPGCFGYAYGMRAAMAIAVAGGYTYRAKENEFVVTRADGIQFVGTHDTLIFPGDVIEVAERFF
jgi:polysaccharide export outer membrane protein